MKLKEFNRISNELFNCNVKITLHDGTVYIGKHAITRTVLPIVWIGNTSIYVKDIKTMERWRENLIYKYVLVEYENIYSSKEYSYRTSIKDIRIGDIVSVDAAGSYEEARVTDIFYCRRDDAPYPVEKTKLIDAVLYDERDEDEDDDDEDEFGDENDYLFDLTKCPKCNARLLRIVYGMPGYKMLKLAEKEEIYLGGCNVPSFRPKYYCRKCKKELYQDLSFKDETDELREIVFKKLEEYEQDIDNLAGMKMLFDHCENIYQALTNINTYLDDPNTSKTRNDLFVQIFRETNTDFDKVEIEDDYEYFIDQDEENNILIRLDLTNGRYYMFTIALTENGFEEQWLEPEEYDSSIKDKTMYYDFNKLRKLKYQNEVDDYIKKFHEDLGDYFENKDDETRKFEQEEKHAEFEPFEYYIDIHDKSLIRLNKDTNEWYEFVVNQHEGNLTKTWMKLNKINEKDLKRIYNYQKVIDYTDKYIEDIKNGIDDVDVDIDEITKKDYLTLQEKWEIDDKLLDSTLNKQIKD